MKSLFLHAAGALLMLVFSTDLSDRNADLKVLARILNLNGPAGREALAGFGEGNFATETTNTTPVPEPTSLLLVASGVVAWIGRSTFRARLPEGR